jgi:hypothetical protein
MAMWLIATTWCHFKKRLRKPHFRKLIKELFSTLAGKAL